MRWLAACLVACGACSATVVEVTVDVRPGIEELTALDVVAKNDGDSATQTFDLTGRVFPLSFTVTPEGRSGEITIELVGRDAAGIGRGAARVSGTIAEGDTLELAARLDPADFVVNTITEGVQRPAFRPGRNGRQIAPLASGGFAVSFVNDCQNPDTCDVFVRRFDGDGRPIGVGGGSGEEVAANGGSYPLVSVPAIAGLEGGEIAVAWEISDAIVTTVIGDDGAVVLADTEVDLAAATDAVDPALASLANGGAAVVWSQENVDASNPAGVYQSLYDRAGNALGAQVLVRDSITAVTPAVTQLDGGELAVLWAEGPELMMAVTPAGGAPGAALSLRGYEDGSQLRSPTAAALGGRVVAGWSVTVPSDDRFNPTGLMIGLFESDGTRVAERLLAGPGAAASDTPAVAVDGEGHIAATWHRCGDDGDGDGCGVFLQLFDGQLEPLTQVLRVNTTIADDQLEPSVAAFSGGFAVVWADQSGAPPDTSTAVRARPLYLDALLP